VFLFVAGFGYLALNTHATSRLQLEVEERQRGRIMALWSIAFLGLRPFVSLGDGVIAPAGPPGGRARLDADTPLRVKRENECERREGAGCTNEEAHVPSVTCRCWTPVTRS
jgi:hypothetical protein